MGLSSAATDRAYEFMSEKYKSSAGILLNSRTVVEKKDYVSTGVLTYAEGDILEVELPQYRLFELGDTVKLTIYSPGGIYIFHSKVVAKDHGALMIINPPQNQSRFADKRENPRIDVNHKGQIYSITGKRSGKKQELHQAIALNVLNISLSGVGFTLDEELELGREVRLEVEMDLGFPFPCVAEIVRKEATPEGMTYYGARYVELVPEKVNALRAYVLKKQVESYFAQKKDEEMNRKFR